MKYTSIKSVLAQLALTLDDRYWNETTMLEHATRAFRQLNIEAKWETKTLEDTIEEHKLTLPADLKYLLQIAYQDVLYNGSSDAWKPLRLASTPFASSVCIYGCSSTCTTCTHQYSISPSGIVTATIKDANVLVSYLAYPTDEDGFALIPDDESLKEAIFHYVLYRYWLQKDLMKEDGAEKRMAFHLQMWNTLSKKALSLNLPDTATMENLKNIQNRMVKNEDHFQTMFTNLGVPQINSF